MRSPLLLLMLLVGCQDPTEDPDEPDDVDPYAPAESLAGPVEAPSAAAVDRFGVAKIYPTIAGGREWTLPDNAEQSNPEWSPQNGNRGKLVKTSQPGVFRVRGGPRLPVKSPAGKKWFRNVEVTGYYKLREKIVGDEEMSPLGNYGYQLLVRGELHRSGTVAGSSINGGVPPPSGTKAGPGYPFAAGASVNAHCVAASYHTNMNVDGRVLFKKEISHTDGYTDGAVTKRPLGGGEMKVGKWYGFKLVARNANGDKAVKLENWVDASGDGSWVKIGEYIDDGGWNAQVASIDGCDAAPFEYKKNQVLTWAGPAVLFRFDNVEADVKWFSVREIAPLP